MASVEALAPYQPNAQGLTEALIDLKSTMPSQTVFKVTGYETTSVSYTHLRAHET